METRDAPKLRRVKRLDSIRLDAGDRTYFTDEGYLVDHPILTSCGIFEYTNPDGSIRRELRLPEYVFAKESLKTYKGKPIIITHEAGVVSKDNVDREQIGTILTEGYQDGEDVRAEVIIHNTDAMDECGLKELSLGYGLDLVEKPGVWNGEPYDAIQTNIVINHLALVASARVGEQARLNLDGSDEPTLKGGKAMPNVTKVTHNDSGAMLPDDLQKAIKAYKAGNAEKMSADKRNRLRGDSIDMTPEELIAAIKQYKEGNQEEPTVEEIDSIPTPPDGEQPIAGNLEKPVGEEVSPGIENPSAVQTATKEKKDGNVGGLIKAVEELLAAVKVGNDDGESQCLDSDVGAMPFGEEPTENDDSSEDQSQSLNNDSTDEIFRQRLSICRVGDKLHMDGLEEKSISDAKKAIVSKVLPDMRLDGKSKAYVNAAYDIAVETVNKRKDVGYQKQQMAGNAVNPALRADAKSNVSMASTARQKMLEREGGNE